MPRSSGGFAFSLAVALIITNYAVAVEGDRDVATGGDQGYDHVDFSIGGGDKGQGHVDFCIDPGAAYSVEVELLPGENGAEICCLGERGNGHVDLSIASYCLGERGNTHVDWRIAIRADGVVEVNGEQTALCDPAEGCRVSLAWCPGTGALVVQVADVAGTALAAQYAIAEAPEEVCITAAEVRSLSVVRR